MIWVVLIHHHYIDNSGDKLSKNNLIQNFPSDIFFKQYWQITEHADVAVITSKRKVKFKCTLALQLDTPKMKS